MFAWYREDSKDGPHDAFRETRDSLGLAIAEPVLDFVTGSHCSPAGSWFLARPASQVESRLSSRRITRARPTDQFPRGIALDPQLARGSAARIVMLDGARTFAAATLARREVSRNARLLGTPTAAPGRTSGRGLKPSSLHEDAPPRLFRDSTFSAVRHCLRSLETLSDGEPKKNPTRPIH